MTRAKRDTLPDGKSNNIDRVPPPAYYKPKYGVIEADQFAVRIRTKDIEQEELIAQRDGLLNPNGKSDRVDGICKKMVRALVRHQTLSRSGIYKSLERHDPLRYRPDRQ